MSAEELEKCTASLAAWVAASRTQELKERPALQEARLVRASRQKRKHSTTRLSQRLGVGERFEAWCKGEGQHSKAALQEFLQRTHKGFELGVPKKDRVWLARCLKLYKRHREEHPEAGALVEVGVGPRNRRVPCCVARVPRALRHRSFGLQGASYKCPELRELLWDWFVDTRASVASTLTPHIVLCKARELASKLMAAMRLTGCYSTLPDLGANGSAWLLRWKRDKGVTLR